MVTEQTQFSMAELEAFRLRAAPPATKREEAMAAFLEVVYDFTPQGGIGNIQRVRVLADPAKPEERRYEFTTKLPPEMAASIEEKKRREAAVAQFQALLASDPKAADEFLRKVAYALLDRMTLLAYLEAAKAKLKPSKPTRKAPPAKKPLRKTSGPVTVSRKSFSDFEKACEQDRRNRIEAAKQAAKQFHAGSKKAS